MRCGVFSVLQHVGILARVRERQSRNSVSYFTETKSHADGIVVTVQLVSKSTFLLLDFI